ncbi:MAG: DUF2934 domain-containing protein [Candidatus Polarisedimenticolaceae bacterium]|nr:DUF2934 domain-containing protein [Candidatus Polarisedimenticolaceae bacterium]
MNAMTSTSKKKAVTKKRAVAKKAVAPKKKVTTKSPVVKKKVATKKRAVSKKSVVAKTAVPSVSNKDRYEMISTMAYFRSEKRSFEPGYAVDDWLECERLIDEMISKA